MINRILHTLFIGALCLSVDVLVAQDRDPRSNLHPKDSAVKLRLLSKPFAKLYNHKQCTEDHEVKSLPAFSVFHVLAMPSQREGDLQYYEVADGTASSLGYMKESDVVQWKQALCLQFEHMGNREPVLMFNDKQSLKSLIDSDEDARVSRAREYYKMVEDLSADQTVPANFPVVSMEPRRMMSSSVGSYLMPIVDFESVEMGDYDCRLLKVAIAAGRATPRGSTTLKDKEYLKSATQETDAADASKAPIEIVYCFDLSGSMQKYVDICRQLAASVSMEMGKLPGFRERVRFGLWGFRDHGEEGQEFVVKNFTPQLQDIDSFVSTLSMAKASNSRAGDYEEDLLGGVSQAVDHSWTENSLRVLVICGDAPGHDQPHDSRNGSRKGIEQIRETADANNVYVYGIHILDPKFERYHYAGQTHFRGLSRNKGTGQESYVSVRGDSVEQFNMAARSLYAALNTYVNAPVEQVEKALETRPDMENYEPAPEVVANDMFRAAMVDWIGRNSRDSQTPNDLTAWISERDLLNSEPAVRPTVLVSRVQLTQLTEGLQFVLDAGLEGRQTGRDFFASLQSVAAAAVRDPHQLQKATSLKESGLIPEFISGLPYKSRMLSLTNDLWASWPPTQQEKFLEDVQKMIAHYKDIHNTPARWVDLDGQSSNDDEVTSIPLDLLP